MTVVARTAKPLSRSNGAKAESALAALRSPSASVTVQISGSHPTPGEETAATSAFVMVFAPGSM